MTRLTLIARRDPELQRVAALQELRAHILFMLEFYHRMRAELGLSPDPGLLRPKTPLEAAAEQTWGSQEPTP